MNKFKSGDKGKKNNFSSPKVIQKKRKLIVFKHSDLRKMRVKLQLSVQDVANLCQVTTASVHGHEKDQIPSDHMKEMYCTLHNCQLHHLMTIENREDIK